MSEAGTIRAKNRPASAGASRLVGIEIELGGLSEDRLARFAQSHFGGEVRHSGDQKYVVEGSDLGDIEIYLDTSLRKDRESALKKLGLEAARGIIPVEIVLPPIAPARIADLDRFCATAREAGAEGSRDGLLLGYGLHLNVQTAASTLAHILPVLQAYALLEDLLRALDPIDPSRRLLPFVDPYPRALVDDLADRSFADLDELTLCYLDHVTSRNHGLDMLPIFADLNETLVRERIGDKQKLSPRPTYHFRLPECRIDEPDWSIAREWDRWCALERVAQHEACLAELKAGWTEHRAAWTTLRPHWAPRSHEILKSHSLDKLFG